MSVGSDRMCVRTGFAAVADNMMSTAMVRDACVGCDDAGDACAAAGSCSLCCACVVSSCVVSSCAVL